MTDTMNGLVAFIAYGGLITIGVMTMLQVSNVYNLLPPLTLDITQETIFKLTATATDESNKNDPNTICDNAAEGACAVAAQNDADGPYNPVDPLVDEGDTIYCTTNVDFCHKLWGDKPWIHE